MQAYAFDAVVFLLRGEPFHKAHLKILTRALALGARVVVVFGSHRKAPDTYNPWTAAERETMVRSCLDAEDLSRVSFTAVRDHPYKNSVWLGEVHARVQEALEGAGILQVSDSWSDKVAESASPKIGLIGYKKDATSTYLEWFPQWEFIDTASFSKGVSATEIRHSYFMESLDFSDAQDKFLASKTLLEANEAAVTYHWREHVPPPVAEFLEAFRTKEPERFKSLLSEYKHILQKKALKEGYPYPVIENTADSVVTKNAHVLLVRRGEDPGKGKWALPGGYLQEYEDRFDAAVRELFEETKLIFPEYLQNRDRTERYKREIIKCLVDSEEFGHPRRSTRGRVITRAYHFELPDEGDFPIVKGNDDAVEARWVPFGDLGQMEEVMFEDHLHIINHFVWNLGKKWRRG